MTRAAMGSVVQQMEVLIVGGTAAGLTDRQLLVRFNSQHGFAREAAFSALVTRHGPMVLDVCRQLLGDRHHAEDAFQAVFLVLARKAGSIRDPELLGNWLYGVSLRIARKAKGQLVRQRKNEESDNVIRADSGPEVPPADARLIAREAAEALHEEIDRLPRSFRLPIVLCYFEGLTLDEAARRLSWPNGTVRSRLARGRGKLRAGLTRRGVVLPAAALSVALHPDPPLAQLSLSLCQTTLRAAMQFAVDKTAGGAVSAAAAVLAREVLRSMLMKSVKFTILNLIMFTTFVTGAGYVAQSQAASKGKPGVSAAAVVQPTRPAPTPERMIVTGRVLDPDGKPVRGAFIDIVGRPRKPWVGSAQDRSDHELLGQGESDADGRFRFEAAQGASDRYFEVYALAAAPGLALGWAELNADAAQPAADLRLKLPQKIQGKLVEPGGKPAAGVELRVWSIGRPTKTGWFDGVNMGNSVSPQGMRTWPRPVVTDDQGRFTLEGIGRDLQVRLGCRDPRFAPDSFRVQTDDRDGPKEVTFTLNSSTTIAGRTLAVDTGLPLAQSLVELASGPSELGLGRGPSLRADQEGRFTARVSPGRYYQIKAFPPEGQPYVVTQMMLEQTKDAVSERADVRVLRGVVIRGKVLAQGSNRPLSGASVQYIASRRRDHVLDGWQAVVASKEDGSFQIALPPGKGHLFVYGPTSDYVLDVIGSRMIYSGKPGGERYYAHAIIPYEVNAGDAPHQINAVLRPGASLKGRLVGPEGQTVEDAQIIGLLHFNYFHLNWRGDLTRHARDGRFEIHGLDPEKPTRISFLDDSHQWGATVNLSHKHFNEPVEIRLEPCGQARGRFVGPEGKPVVNIFPYLELLGSQGPDKSDRRPESQEQLAADGAYLPNLDRSHYWHGPFTGSDGRIVLPDLIPGAWYRIGDPSMMNVPNKGVQVRKEFSVKAGETIDLGDILIEKPQR